MNEVDKGCSLLGKAGDLQGAIFRSPQASASNGKPAATSRGHSDGSYSTSHIPQI